MESLFIVLFLILLGIFIAFYHLINIEIKSITKQLNTINNNENNAKILMNSSFTNLGKLAIQINNTLREKQENEIKYKRKDTELREAIANISHDLRTPLTSIMGYIQFIEENTLSEEEKKEYISIVKNRTKTLKGLINHFYELSRLESKDYNFNLKYLNLYNVMTDMILSFYNDFLNKGLEPSMDIEENSSLIIADEDAVRRILSNLIQNMLKYGEGFIGISLKQEEKYLITTFTNDAPNLNEEDAQHLFERFFTADRARTGQSTGLGLAITKELVEQMGHMISLKLDQGKLSIIIKWKTR